MKQEWINSKRNADEKDLSPMANHFLDEVSSIIFDALFKFSYFHWDIRWPNILFDGQHFYVIDWEGGLNVKYEQTSIRDLIDRRINLLTQSSTSNKQYTTGLNFLLEHSVLFASAAYLCEKLLRECLDKYTRLMNFIHFKVARMF